MLKKIKIALMSNTREDRRLLKVIFSWGFPVAMLISLMIYADVLPIGYRLIIGVLGWMCAGGIVAAVLILGRWPTDVEE